jgi:hypothetical protein
MHLFKRKEIWLPTWSGWALIFIILFGLAICFFLLIDAFLSVNAPVTANVLVVEGWLPENALKEAASEIKRNGYDHVVTSGGPIEEQEWLVSGFDTWASLASAILQKLQIPKDKLIEAPAAESDRNRTFASALVVKAKLDELGITIRGLNVLTEGPHARRSRLVYRKVFDKKTSVGVLSIKSVYYDEVHWWRSSVGIEDMLEQGLGWLYESLLSSGR